MRSNAFSLFFACSLALLLSTGKSELIAQSFRITHAPLRCQGPLPVDYLALSSEKVRQDKDKAEQRDGSKREKKLHGEFSVNINFGVDEMLLSGKVLFGDPLSIYVNNIADVILESDTPLRKKLRFYVLKSSTVNAFCTNQGIIFVTVGLLSQIKNEAQLAGILCHEVMHYVKQHGFERFKKQKDIIAGKGRFKYLSLDDRINAMYRYSKDHELEADRLGMELFLKTPYKTSEVISSFDIMLYSYLAWDELDWTPAMLEDSTFHFPASYTPSKFKPVKADEDEDDYESTHPNIRKRKESVEKILDRKGHHGDSLYILGKTLFDDIQQQARIELFHICMNQGQYEKAFYMTHLYRNRYRDTVWSDKITAYCLYALSKPYDRNFGYSENESGETVQGAYYNVRHFFREIPRKDLAAFSVRNAWRYSRLNPEDSFSAKLLHASVHQLFKSTSYTYGRFFHDDSSGLHSDTSALKDIAEQQMPDTTKMTKVELKRYRKKMEEIGAVKDGNKTASDNSDYLTMMFKPLESDSAFTIFFRNTFDSTRKFHKDEDDEFYISWRGLSKEKRREYRRQKRYGKAGGIDTLMLLNPNFSRIVVQKRDKRDPLFDEKQEIILASKFEDMARANGITSSTLNLMDKENLSTQKLNTYAMIMDWVSQKARNDEQDFLMFDQQLGDSIMKHTGTGNICLSYILYSIDDEEDNAVSLFDSPLLYPLMIYQLFTRVHEVYLSVAVFDLKNNIIRYTYISELKFKYRKKDHLNNQIYALFHQISKH